VVGSRTGGDCSSCAAARNPLVIFFEFPFFPEWRGGNLYVFREVVFDFVKRRQGRLALGSDRGIVICERRVRRGAAPSGIEQGLG